MKAFSTVVLVYLQYFRNKGYILLVVKTFSCERLHETYIKLWILKYLVSVHFTTITSNCYHKKWEKLDSAWDVKYCRPTMPFCVSNDPRHSLPPARPPTIIFHRNFIEVRTISRCFKSRLIYPANVLIC